MSLKTFINYKWFSFFSSVLVPLWHLAKDSICSYSMPLLSIRSGYLEVMQKEANFMMIHSIRVTQLFLSPQLSMFLPFDSENPILWRPLAWVFSHSPVWPSLFRPPGSTAGPFLAQEIQVLSVVWCFRVQWRAALLPPHKAPRGLFLPLFQSSPLLK